MPDKLQKRPPPPPAQEQRSIQLADKLISYTLKRSGRRRSIGLQINDQGLTVSMPLRASEKWLHSVLQEKSLWVLDKLESWQSKQAPVERWADGAALLFRGETFTLRIIPGLFSAAPQLTHSELIIHVVDTGNQAAVNKKMLKWYKHEALRVFNECVEHFASLMSVSPREIKLTSARTQWGSCTSQGVVRLNWQLVTMPLHLIDYVVVHELAHLLEMNHSPAFWRVVQSVCPDYIKMRRELRNWSPATPEL
ncbi:MAG TPA: SprT family zinc-dependent metalloprotease [Gallionellaceae bacterium]|nr:SprT family zinc-dependent metalloprotease [Gallionellaceae bacterium]